MATIHRGATLTPHFRDFLPAWVARQPWYRGVGTPTLSPIGYFRFEDPAGEVGIETHLVTDGTALYQVPMTYRDAPLENSGPRALITTAEHSVLGTRRIYDAEHDPVWRSELLHLVRTNGVSDPSGRSGVGPAEARGRLTGSEFNEDVHIELARVLCPGQPVAVSDIVGVVAGTWHPNGPDATPESGCLAVVRNSGNRT